MKIFITGASGFVGGAAAAFLARKGHEVVAMSRSADSDARISLLGAWPVRCSLADTTPAHLQGIDVVVHAAAFVGEWGNYQTYFETNVTGTEKMVAAAKQAGVKKFIHISTESVLFAGQDLINVDESYPYPATPFYYSKTKQLAEKAVIAANEPGIFDTICLRPRMIWGPGDKTILPLMKDAVLRRQFIWINGGAFKTSTTHIDNLTHAIALAIDKGKSGALYFITDDETLVLREFCTRLLATQGVKPVNKSMPKWLVRTVAWLIENTWQLLRIKSRPPVTRLGAAIFSSHCTLNIDNAKKELCYLPAISIAAGLAAMGQLNGR
ncbi:MAG: NAD-dependent epimerase/dehydratase family protein [Chitinophagaceae bacterium]